MQNTNVNASVNNTINTTTDRQGNALIINLTQHPAAQEQALQGVFDFEGLQLQALKKALTFEGIPSKEEMRLRALLLAEMAKRAGVQKAMIGGAPYFMSALEKALKDVGIQPLYAFSVRESIEKTLPDGSIQKVNIFKHLGFVEV